MIQLKQKILLTIIFLIGIFSQPSYGSHLEAADITYQYVGANQYLVKVRLYRDCFGVSAPLSAEICYHSVGGNFSSTMQLISTGPAFELPNIPCLPLVVSACNGGTGFAIERYEYTGIVTLPFISDDWMLSYTTQSNPGPGGSIDNAFCVTTKIDNMNYPVNSSPQFIYDPVFLYGINQQSWEDLSAIDTDGDSLHYSFLTSFADSSFCPPQLYIPSIPNDMLPPTSSVPLFIHPEDGWVYFIPTLLQVRYITIKVEEYRNHVLINETSLSHKVITIANCISTDLQEIKTPKLSLYPNPAVDILHISINKDIIVENVELYSVDGKLIFIELTKPAVNGECVIDTHGLVPGVYFIKLTSADHVYNQYFVKN